MRERRRGGKGSVEAMSPESVLAARKDNFALGYEELVSVESCESSGVMSITILTREDKFQFLSNTGLREVAGLLSPSPAIETFL